MRPWPRSQQRSQWRGDAPRAACSPDVGGAFPSRGTWVELKLQLSSKRNGDILKDSPAHFLWEERALCLPRTDLIYCSPDPRHQHPTPPRAVQARWKGPCDCKGLGTQLSVLPARPLVASCSESAVPAAKGHPALRRPYRCLKAPAFSGDAHCSQWHLTLPGAEPLHTCSFVTRA